MREGKKRERERERERGKKKRERERVREWKDSRKLKIRETKSDGEEN